MSFNLLEYYKIINGESSQERGVWHVNYDKKHAFSVHSDYDASDEYVNKISLPPSDAETEIINIFSDKLGQKLKNTRIVDNADGTEKIELELENRIVTIIVDQSGSMTWNDNNDFRYDIITDLIDKIEINYPGNVTYNLIEYGADIVNVLFFGILDEEGIDPNDIDSLSTMIKADDKANYDGIRIIRNDDHYPLSILDGELVDDGFISRIRDDGLVEGRTYYYTVYTYDKDLRFSEGMRIQVVPRERIVPRATSAFKTMVESSDITKGVPFIGTGVGKDDNTLGIWHMNEGEGRNLYDFSNNNAVLVYNKENPTWYHERFVPSGTSGLFLDGVTDYVFVDGVSDLWMNLDLADAEITIMAWVYMYDDTGTYVIASSYDGALHGFEFTISFAAFPELYLFTGTIYHVSGDLSGVLEINKWTHVAVVKSQVGGVDFYVNGVAYSGIGAGGASGMASGNYYFTIGADRDESSVSNFFRGKITEVSVHNSSRDSDYVNAQIFSTLILDGDGIEVGYELTGATEDNGDRLVVFKYDVPRDCNFVGGEIAIVKNEKNIPSWEEDGTVIYRETADSGQFFVSDSDDFVLEEKYYYRLFSKNLIGNVSFQSDSPSLEIEMPSAATEEYFPVLTSYIKSPVEPDSGQLITSGNEKTYLRWEQINPLDSRISRVKIYYSAFDFPDVNRNGGRINQLVFSGLVTDTKFVHRGLRNDKNAYYTIVNTDKYGRVSSYNPEGVQVTPFLHATTIPSSTAEESTFPLVEVENINYELIDENTITIGWDQPQKSVENINAYFDQTVYLYASITDEFGSPIPEGTPVRMRIFSSINKETQADDVFSNINLTDFADNDAYDFFVTRSRDGSFYKAILRMTTNSNIISQIKKATFNIQLQAFLSKNGGYTPPNQDKVSTNPLSEYTSIIEGLVEEIDGASATEGSSTNFYEYTSEVIQVTYTNPWEVTLESRDNQKVSQRCYCEITNDLTGRKSLSVSGEQFNGVYIKASAPFIARAKIKYKGEPVESGNIQVAVWDADSSELCRNACSEAIPRPLQFEGPKLQPSLTIFPPDPLMSVIQGEEDDGIGGTRVISYVDIPLYAPDLPQAVRLFVKGERSGYSSIEEIYILFQNILKIELRAYDPVVDGKDIAEQYADVFIINPDYPDYQTNEYAKSLITYPDDLTVVKWGIKFIQADDDADGSGPRNLYSIDSVPLINGVYSYTRNGMARNVFLGPIPREGLKINETHEINAIIAYKGLTNTARQFIDIGPYNPQEFQETSARFLMEIDGGWRGDLPDQIYGGGGWLGSDYARNTLWADGINYKKIKIHRSPYSAARDGFASATCFITCASLYNNEILSLSSGQIVKIVTGDDDMEIIHGEVVEVEDPYTGQHTVEIGKKGFIDNGTAFIELNDEADSDVTYFYIRANKFIPTAGRKNRECDNSMTINNCLCLGPLDDCDIPEWSPMRYISGTTTVFVNNQPMTLNGGGGMGSGVPPCPIGINEPLKIFTKWRKVIDYFFSKETGDPSNNFLVPVETFAQDNNFLDEDGVTLIKHNSDVVIRLVISWRRQNVPDGTPVYTIIGKNDGNTLFVPSLNVYYTQTEDNEGYSYVDVILIARRPVVRTTKEKVEIYTNYDEREVTDRHMGEVFWLTLDKKDNIIDVPELPTDDEPSGEEDDDEDDDITPFSGNMERYSILDNSWTALPSISEPSGNGFIGLANEKIYYMGGLKNNSLNISNSNEEYDIVNNEWDTKSSMSVGRFAGMYVTIGNDIYIIGGIIQDPDSAGHLIVTDLVEVYHADTDEWETLPPMPALDRNGPFEEIIGVAFGTAQHVEIFDGSDVRNYIYVFGGIQEIRVDTDHFNIRTYNRRILRYWIEGKAWEYSEVLRTNELETYERISPLSIVYDNKIIIFGGALELGGEFIYPLEEFYYDIALDFQIPADGQWINKDSDFLGGFPVPKFQSAMIKYDQEPSVDPASYYIMGGANQSAPSLDILEKMITGGNFTYESSYEQIDPSGPSEVLSSLLVERHGASAIFSGASGSPSIYLIGGYTINRGKGFVDIEFDI